MDFRRNISILIELLCTHSVEQSSYCFVAMYELENKFFGMGPRPFHMMKPFMTFLSSAKNYNQFIHLPRQLHQQSKGMIDITVMDIEYSE